MCFSILNLHKMYNLCDVRRKMNRATTGGVLILRSQNSFNMCGWSIRFIQRYCMFSTKMRRRLSMLFTVMHSHAFCDKIKTHGARLALVHPQAAANCKTGVTLILIIKVFLILVCICYERHACQFHHRLAF